MSLRSKKVHMQRFYLEDKCGDETSYVLCLKGLEPTSALPCDRARKPVEVLTCDVVKELKRLLPPWWKVKTLVEHDVDCRDEEKVFAASAGSERRFGLAKSELVDLGLKPMAENVLLNSDAFETIPAHESALGRVLVIVDSGHPPSGGGVNQDEDTLMADASNQAATSEPIDHGQSAIGESLGSDESMVVDSSSVVTSVPVTQAPATTAALKGVASRRPKTRRKAGKVSGVKTDRPPKSRRTSDEDAA